MADNAGTGRVIKLAFTTMDGFREYKTFRTLKGARAYAKKRLGDAYDVSHTFGYAVNAWGDGKLRVDGATWTELLDYNG